MTRLSEEEKLKLAEYLEFSYVTLFFILIFEIIYSRLYPHTNSDKLSIRELWERLKKHNKKVVMNKINYAEHIKIQYVKKNDIRN